MAPHVMQVSFFVDSARRPPERLLVEWPSLPAVARAAAEAGVRVSVVQASMIEGRFSRDGVDYHFVAPDAFGQPLTRSPRFADLLRDIDPDVVHVHGLGFAREVAALRKLVPAAPFLLQDHAARIPRIWRRRGFRRGARAAQAIAFCARAQAMPFEDAGLFARDTTIFEIPESTTVFTPGDRAAARAATGISGDPAALWVGRLDDNKDPITILDGLARVARQRQDVTLWCCHGDSPLLGQVQARIARDPLLRTRVHLLGRVPHERVETLMRAADLLVLGSHREGSGYAVIEALATGLPAVVTDIPSFRVIVGTGSDAAGVLWPCEDSEAFARAFEACAANLAPLRERALHRFDRELSSRAVGKKLAAAYQALLDS